MQIQITTHPRFETTRHPPFKTKHNGILFTNLNTYGSIGITTSSLYNADNLNNTDDDVIHFF